MTKVRKLETPPLTRFTLERWKSIIIGKLGISETQSVLCITCQFIEDSNELKISISAGEKIFTVHVTNDRTFYDPADNQAWGRKPIQYEFAARKKFVDAVRDFFPEVDWHSIRKLSEAEKQAAEWAARRKAAGHP